MSPVGELELHPAVGGAGTALRPRPQPAYGDRAVRADDGLGQCVGEVGAVPVAGGEVGALDRGFAVPAEPAGEVSGVVRVATHATRGHVEPMPWVGRGVRGAASGLRRRVDHDEVEGHPAARGRLAQLDRRQRAGGARSDDGHGVPLAGWNHEYLRRGSAAGPVSGIPCSLFRPERWGKAGGTEISPETQGAGRLFILCSQTGVARQPWFQDVSQRLFTGISGGAPRIQRINP